MPARFSSHREAKLPAEINLECHPFVMHTRYKYCSKIVRVYIAQTHQALGIIRCKQDARPRAATTHPQLATSQWQSSSFPVCWSKAGVQRQKIRIEYTHSRSREHAVKESSHDRDKPAHAHNATRCTPRPLYEFIIEHSLFMYGINDYQS